MAENLKEDSSYLRRIIEHRVKRRASVELEIKQLRAAGLDINKHTLYLWTLEYEIPFKLKDEILRLTNLEFANKAKVLKRAMGMAKATLYFYRRLERDAFETKLLSFEPSLKINRDRFGTTLANPDVSAIFDAVTGGWDSEEDRVGNVVMDRILEEKELNVHDVWLKAKRLGLYLPNTDLFPIYDVVLTYSDHMTWERLQVEYTGKLEEIAKSYKSYWYCSVRVSAEATNFSFFNEKDAAAFELRLGEVIHKTISQFGFIIHQPLTWHSKLDLKGPLKKFHDCYFGGFTTPDEEEGAMLTGSLTESKLLRGINRTLNRGMERIFGPKKQSKYVHDVWQKAEKFGIDVRIISSTKKLLFPIHDCMICCDDSIKEEIDFYAKANGSFDQVWCDKTMHIYSYWLYRFYTQKEVMGFYDDIYNRKMPEKLLNSISFPTTDYFPMNDEQAKKFYDIHLGFETPEEEEGALATQSLTEGSINKQINLDALKHLMHIEGQDKIQCMSINIPVQYAKDYRNKAYIDHYVAQVTKEALKKKSFVCRGQSKYDTGIRKAFYFFDYNDASDIHTLAVSKLYHKIEKIRTEINKEEDRLGTPYNSYHSYQSSPCVIVSYSWNRINDDMPDRFNMKDMMKRFPSNDEFLGGQATSQLFENDRETLDNMERAHTTSGLTYVQELQIMVKRLKELNIWQVDKAWKNERGVSCKFKSLIVRTHIEPGNPKEIENLEKLEIDLESIDGYFAKREEEEGETLIYDFVFKGPKDKYGFNDPAIRSLIDNHRYTMDSEMSDSDFTRTLYWADAKRYYKMLMGEDFVPTDVEIHALIGDDAMKKLFENETDTLHDIFLKLKMEGVHCFWGTDDTSAYQYISTTGAVIDLEDPRATEMDRKYGWEREAKKMPSFYQCHRPKNQSRIVYDFFDSADAAKLHHLIVSHFPSANSITDDLFTPIVLDNVEDAKKLLRFVTGDFDSHEEEEGYWAGKSLMEAFETNDVSPVKLFQFAMRKLNQQETTFSFIGFTVDLSVLEERGNKEIRLARIDEVLKKLRNFARSSNSFVCETLRTGMDVYDSYQIGFILENGDDFGTLVALWHEIKAGLHPTWLMDDEFWDFKLSTEFNFEHTYETRKMEVEDICQYYKKKTGHILKLDDSELGEVVTGLLV